MKKLYLILIIMLCFLGCKTSSSDTHRRRQIEKELTEALNGTLLAIPLYDESTLPALFLIPVSDDDVDLRVDRLYILNAGVNGVDYIRDVYKIDSVVIDEHIYAYVTNNKLELVKKRLGIDGYDYNIIRKINTGTFQYNSNIKIPVIKKSKVNNL